MKYILISTLVCIITVGSQHIGNSQSVFSTKEAVADYLEGTWDIDVIQGGFAGGTYYLPTPFYYDSTIHKLVFEKTDIDSFQLICSAYIEDTLFQETNVSITQNPSQVLLPRWILNNLPQNIDVPCGLMEEWGFYGFSQDTIVFGGFNFDGYEYGLSKSPSNTLETEYANKIDIYPNPSSGMITVAGTEHGAHFKLFDLSGRIIQQGRIGGTSLSIEAHGIYIISILNQGRWISKKIVVIRYN